MGGNSPYEKRSIYTMGGNIIEISYKNKNELKHCTARHRATQFAERNASDGSIFDAARTGEYVAR